jgi:hypothetical protein
METGPKGLKQTAIISNEFEIIIRNFPRKKCPEEDGFTHELHHTFKEN